MANNGDPDQTPCLPEDKMYPLSSKCLANTDQTALIHVFAWRTGQKGHLRNIGVRVTECTISLPSLLGGIEIQSTLVILTSLISNNCLSRSENLVSV